MTRVKGGKDRVIRRMVELAGSPESPWTAIETRVGATVRRTWTNETPEWARRDWSEPTYHAHVFLTLVAGTFLLGRAPAPWVGRTDSNVPLYLVEAILEDPELGLDTQRQLELRAARKPVRSQP
jgi:hypothetical protein